MTDFSLVEARRIALAAQGLDRPPEPGRVPGSADLAATIRRLGLLQLDFVNVVLPAHYLVPFSRLGSYDRRLLDELVYRRPGGPEPEFTEQWAREASIVPLASWPLLAWRRAEFRPRPWGFEAFLNQWPEYTDRVRRLVGERGPLAADELPPPDGGAPQMVEHSWFGSVARAVAETHFGRGTFAIADRRPNFARVYDLAERVIPAAQHGRAAPRDEAQRELLLQAARAHGLATAGDLADYLRLSAADARPRLAELTDAGAVETVRVEGWREPAFLHPATPAPAEARGQALLAPFDPLVWTRARAARLFGFDYRFEIFVPDTKRRWGTYVLPFLLGERLVARVDLKADRPGRRLQVLAAYLEEDREPAATPSAVAAALAAELARFAAWLGLANVAVGRRGDFARALSAAVRAGRPVRSRPVGPPAP